MDPEQADLLVELPLADQRANGAHRKHLRHRQLDRCRIDQPPMVQALQPGLEPPG
jgi:hypothetical protein